MASGLLVGTWRRGMVAAAVLAVAGLGANTVRGVSTWTGGGTTTVPGSGNWNNATNWSAVGVPASSNAAGLAFGNAAGSGGWASTDDIGGAFVLNTITLSNADGGNTDTIGITGGATGLTLAGAAAVITQSGAGAFTIAAPLTLTTGTTVGGVGTGPVALSGGLTNSGANYTLTNSMPGKLTIGDVSLSENGAVGRTLMISGAGNTVITGTVANASGASSAASSVNYTGTGTLTLAGANNYSGTTTLNGGTLIVGSTTALGTSTLAWSAGVLAVAADTPLVTSYAVTVSDNRTIKSGRATAGAGLTQTLGVLNIGQQELTAQTGPNVTTGVPAIAFGSTSVAAATTALFTAASANLLLGNVTSTGASIGLKGTTTGNTAGAIAIGAGNVTLQGSGGCTWTFTGACTYTGFTQVNAGNTLIVTGTLGNTAVTVSGGLNLQNSGAISQNTVTVQGSGTLVESATNALSGSAALTVNPSTVTLSNANNYTGNTALGGGTLNLNAAGAISASAITVSTGSISESAANGLTGTASLRVNGGTVTLSQANNYAGATNLSGGTLSLSAVGAISASTLTLTGGTFSPTMANTISGSAALAIPVNLSATIGYANNYTGATSFTAGGTLNVASNALGTGPLALAGVGTLAGTGGPVVLSNSGTTLSSSFVINGAQPITFTNSLTNAAGNTLTNNISVAGGLTLGDVFLSDSAATGRLLTLNGSGNTTVTGVVANGSGASPVACSLTYSGSGKLTLLGTNTYSGTTTLASGTLVVGNTSALGTSSLTWSGGILDLAADAPLVTSYAVTMSGDRTVESDRATAGAALTHTLGTLNIGGMTLFAVAGGNVSSGTPTVAFSGTSVAAAVNAVFSASSANLALGNITSTGTASLALQGSGTTGSTAGAIATGAGNVTVQGTGGCTWTITGACTYTGTTSVNTGSVLVITGSLGNTAVAVNGGLNLQSAGAISQKTVVVQGAGTLTETVANALSGSVAVNINNTAVVTLGYANNYTGTTTLAGATLTVGASGALGSGSFVFSAGTLQAAAPTTLANPTTLSGAGVISGSQNLTLAGNVTGGGSLTYNGSGVLTLSGTGNNYTANTTVNSGMVVFAAAGARPAGKTIVLGKDATPHGGMAVLYTGESDAQVRGEVQAGTITAAAGAAAAHQAVGYLTTDQYDALDSAGLTLGGVVTKYTWLGDLNLDGQVSLKDYRLMDAGYLLGFDGTASHRATWYNGDITGAVTGSVPDGIVDYHDFAAADAALAAQSSVLADAMFALHGAEFGSPYLAALNADLATVPEPAGLGLLGMGGIVLLRRRRMGRLRG